MDPQDVDERKRVNTLLTQINYFSLSKTSLTQLSGLQQKWYLHLGGSCIRTFKNQMKFVLKFNRSRSPLTFSLQYDFPKSLEVGRETFRKALKHSPSLRQRKNPSLAGHESGHTIRAKLVYVYTSLLLG